MILKKFAASVFGLALFAAPLYAVAAQDGGTVCGRVDAPQSFIFQLQQSPTHDNVIVARSQSEEVQAFVSIDGRYCFTNLHTDIHTIVAFEDVFPTMKATVTPIAGQTLIIDLTEGNIAGL